MSNGDDTVIGDGYRVIGDGYCVHRPDSEHCVDVLRMIWNWRVVLTARKDGDPHLTHERGYCYFGLDYPVFLRALKAARAWDGQGDPEGYDKRAF